ncbi:MAG TPA: hypothetical protein GXX53_00455 [Tissierellia bacterium]|nr:hypothetical protein [Tissierellia bacterium]
MKKKITVIIVSLLFAIFILSGGYGHWSDTITVEGNIEVLPDLEDIETTRQHLLLMKQQMESIPNEEEIEYFVPIYDLDEGETDEQVESEESNETGETIDGQ